jgi:thiol-disulfide isomerase/thioredoxin
MTRSGRAILTLNAWVAAAVLTATPLAAAPVPVSRAVIPGDAAPPLVARALEGWKFRAEWSRFEYTLVNFWATWCEPCRTEMPVLQDLVSKFKDRNLGAVGVVLDSATDDEVRAYASSLGISYRLVRGDTDVSNLWGGIGILPTTFVVDSKGRVLRRYAGATAEQVERLRSDIEALFPPPAAKPER